jgi:hypothetical protein
MLRTSQSGNVRSAIWLAAIAALGIWGLATPAHAADVITFNPDGTGPVGPAGVLTFDEDPGNALLVGVLPITPFTPFPVLYQAEITGLKSPDPMDPSTDIGIFNYGSAGNVFGELSIVARFFEIVTNVTFDANNNATVTLATAPSQAGSFFQIYYDSTHGPNGDASNLLGTGFNNGILIYTGTVIAGGQVGSFSNDAVTNPAVGGTPTALDVKDTDNYPGLTTVSGAGGTDLSVLTTSFDPNFFVTNITGAIFGFNTSVKLPFGQTNPSAVMFDGTAAAGTPGTAGVGGTIGPVNGFSGPNQLLQADANSSFSLAAVPEPGTISMALTGVGLTSLAALRRRLRTRTAA